MWWWYVCSIRCLTTTLVLILFVTATPIFLILVLLLCMHDGTGIYVCAAEAIHVIIPCACTCAARGKVIGFVYLSVRLSACLSIYQHKNRQILKSAVQFRPCKVSYLFLIHTCTRHACTLLRENIKIGTGLSLEKLFQTNETFFMLGFFLFLTVISKFNACWRPLLMLDCVHEQKAHGVQLIDVASKIPAYQRIQSIAAIKFIDVLDTSGLLCLFESLWCLDLKFHVENRWQRKWIALKLAHNMAQGLVLC